MSSFPIDPTQPREPVVVPAHRPAPVTVAALLMFLGALLGLISAVALFIAAGTVVSRFRTNAQNIDVSTQTVNDVAAAIRGVFIGLGVMSLILALVMVALAFGVLQGRNGARITTLVVAAAALCCGLGTASYTAVGRGADWTNANTTNEQVAAEVGQAYSDSVPAALVGATGGLTDLQVLSYIAVAVLLLLPVSNAYFRRRSTPVTPAPPSSSSPTVFGPPPSIYPYPYPYQQPPSTNPPVGPPGPPGPDGP